MAEKILTEYKQRVSALKLVPFDDGRFEVIVNGKKVYSKLDTHRFPEYREVRSALQKQGG